jgi:hypothetical protein
VKVGGDERLRHRGLVAVGDRLVGVVPDGVRGAVVAGELDLVFEGDPDPLGVLGDLLGLQPVERRGREPLLHREAHAEQHGERRHREQGQAMSRAHRGRYRPRSGEGEARTGDGRRGRGKCRARPETFR